jgi:hypothetical protein
MCVFVVKSYLSQLVDQKWAPLAKSNTTGPKAQKADHDESDDLYDLDPIPNAATTNATKFIVIFACSVDQTGLWISGREEASNLTQCF